MDTYGIRGQALRWFESYLRSRKHFVSYQGKNSTLYNISCVIPQGSILGPLLFIIYINDLPRVLKFARDILFADDFELLQIDNMYKCHVGKYMFMQSITYYLNHAFKTTAFLK